LPAVHAAQLATDVAPVPPKKVPAGHAVTALMTLVGQYAPALHGLHAAV
jgi:hypothetical protein